MTPLTDAEKVRLLIQRAELDSEESNETPRQRVQKAIKISRTKLHDLLNGGGVLSQGRHRKWLDAEIHRVFAEPGSDRYRDRLEEIRAHLGDRPGSLANVRMIDAYYIDLAFRVWAMEALDETKTPAARLLAGRMAHRIMFDWLKLIERRLAEGVDLFSVPDEEVAERGLRVVEALVQIVRQQPQAPEGLFTYGTDAARRTGYKVFRAKLASDHLGWLSRDQSMNAARYSDIMHAAYKGGAADDMVWLSKIQPDEIAWTYNPWAMAMHAGDWRRVRELAPGLFYNTAILKKKVSGLKAVKDDPEMWPAMWAILDDREMDALDALRDTLHSGHTDFAPMMSAISRARPALTKNSTYTDAFSAIKGAAQ